MLISSMSNEPQIAIVSDTHVKSAEDPLYRRLLGWIREEVQGGDTLVLNGDIFDLFIGGQEVFHRRYAQLIELIRAKAVQGTQVHYIEGNHDLYMGRVFGSSLNIQVHGEQVEMQWGGRRIYVAHGDLVDQDDRGYLALRSFLRGRAMRFATHVASGSWVDGVGRWSSEKSGRKTRREPSAEKAERIRGLFRDFARERFEDGVDRVVLGHNHLIDDWSLQVDGRDCQYVNMGYPPTDGTILVCRQSLGRFERAKF